MNRGEAEQFDGVVGHEGEAAALGDPELILQLQVVAACAEDSQTRVEDVGCAGKADFEGSAAIVVRWSKQEDLRWL